MTLFYLRYIHSHHGFRRNFSHLPTLNSTKQLLQAILLHRFRLEVVPGAAGKVEEIPWTKNDMN